MKQKPLIRTGPAEWGPVEPLIECCNCGRITSEQGLIRMYQSVYTGEIIDAATRRNITGGVQEWQPLDACENCKTDEFLMDI